jgi:hypothetical protein
MPNERKKPRESLSDISHLFLSGLRQRQTGGAPVPTRKPPLSMVSVDLTPEEFGEGQTSQQRPGLSAVLAHHLGAAAVQRVRDYARFAATVSGRVGLIELGDHGLRLTCYDASPLGKLDADAMASPADAPAVEPVHGKRIAEALEEMSWDIQRWVLFLPGGAKSEKARQLLSKIDHWTVLAAADDEGIVSAYRALKGIADAGKASLSMAVLAAETQADGEQAHRKLAGASKQFLGRQLDYQGRVLPAESVSEHVVLWCRAAATPDAPQDHWTAVRELAEKSNQPLTPLAEEPAEPAAEEIAAVEEPVLAEPAPAEPPLKTPIAEEPVEAPSYPSIPLKITPMEKAFADRGMAMNEVVDLDAGADQAEAIVATILRRETFWVTCPVKAPACPSATIAVDRDGRLVLAAAAGAALADLPVVSRAFAWLIENRGLVRMAMPQINIDAKAMPRLMLAVDQADSTGGKLAVLLGGADVSVRTYRRLRWGEKTGLLLEAA